MFDKIVDLFLILSKHFFSTFDNYKKKLNIFPQKIEQRTNQSGFNTK